MQRVRHRSHIPVKYRAQIYINFGNTLICPPQQSIPSSMLYFLAFSATVL